MLDGSCDSLLSEFFSIRLIIVAHSILQFKTFLLFFQTFSKTEKHWDFQPDFEVWILIKSHGESEDPPWLNLEISRILFQLSLVAIISLWTNVAAGLEARDPSYPRTTGVGFPTRTACACTRWGFPCLVCHQTSGALLPHLFTLATRSRRSRSAVSSLWHCP